MENKTLCPFCQKSLTQVGKYFICPEHGQISTGEKSHSPLRIFLSYGHDENEELVRMIKSDLEKRGHDVWFDKNEIKFGDDWRRAITDGILGSNRVLSFLSKYSTRDPGVCRDEIAIAIGVKGGNIQTILVESEAEVQPPVNIGHIQWLDMHDWRKLKESEDTVWESWYTAKFEEIVQVIESEENRRFAGEIETLSNYLKPISSDSRIHQLLKKGFYGRNWLFDSIEQWRNDRTSDSHLFWIMGDPGVGKSAFAAQLTHTRGDIVIAAQFCEWDKPDHRDARRVVCSVAFQLAARLPDYRKLLLTLSEIRELDHKNPDELFDYLLANPMKCAINGRRGRFLIVIDALDEAGESGRNPLVDMLARNAIKLPDWIGIIVTSRPEFDVKTPFQALNPFPLDTKSESNRSDLYTFLKDRLVKELQYHRDPENLLKLIIEKSEGLFLYVERFCDDIQKGNLSLDNPDQFPKGLGGIFTLYFERQFPDLNKFRNEVRPALRMILAAREPLPLEILQKKFNWQDEELHDFKLNLGSLFPLIKESGTDAVKPYHKSLSDWLGDESMAGVFYVSVMEGHRMLLQQGWKEYLKNGVLNLPLYDIRHLPFHLAALQRWDDLCLLLCDIQFTDQKCKEQGALSLLFDFRLALTRLPESDIVSETDIIKENPFSWTKKLIEYAGHFLPTNRLGRLRMFGAFLEGINTTRDGSLAITINARRAVEIWDLRTQKCIRVFRSEYSMIPTCVNIAYDGSSFLVGGNNGLIQAIQLDTGNTIWTLRGHTWSIQALVITEDGHRVITASADKTLTMWDLKSGMVLQVFRGHSDIVTSLGITPDGKYLVSGSFDSTLIIWDLVTGNALKTLSGHIGEVRQVRLSFDGSRIVSLGQDGTIRLWDIMSGECLQIIDNIGQ